MSFFVYFCIFCGWFCVSQDKKNVTLWQSRAHPREIMTEVLKALQELNVCWKKIGHYNMKCRWYPCFPGQGEGMHDNNLNNNHCFGDESAIVESDDVAARSSNVVKFELQVRLPFSLTRTHYDKNLTVYADVFIFLFGCHFTIKMDGWWYNVLCIILEANSCLLLITWWCLFLFAVKNFFFLSFFWLDQNYMLA